jgi:hypothetical protein
MGASTRRRPRPTRPPVPVRGGAGGSGTGSSTGSDVRPYVPAFTLPPLDSAALPASSMPTVCILPPPTPRASGPSVRNRSHAWLRRFLYFSIVVLLCFFGLRGFEGEGPGSVHAGLAPCPLDPRTCSTPSDPSSLPGTTTFPVKSIQDVSFRTLDGGAPFLALEVQWEEVDSDGKHTVTFEPYSTGTLRDLPIVISYMTKSATKYKIKTLKAAALKRHAAAQRTETEALLLFQVPLSFSFSPPSPFYSNPIS